MRFRTSRRRAQSASLAITLSALAGAPSASAYQLFDSGGFSANANLNLRMGFRHGEEINFGKGALAGFGQIFRSTGEKSRNDLEVAAKPFLGLKYQLDGSELYSGVSVVGATTTLDGELSGQMARSGDRVLKTDHAYVGWRNETFDLSFGAQEFSVGDGLIIGDGNFNQGHDNGQYWTGAFAAWRNTGILKINTSPIRADLYWLRTDADLGGSDVVGINVENSSTERFGRLGLMYFEIVGDNNKGLAQGVGFKGMKAMGVRGADLHLPGHPEFKIYGEYVYEGGRSELTGIPNDGAAWYVEPAYEFESLPWKPRLHYRYSHFSGDTAGTRDNEEYRGMFFTIFRRDWDTWYQGEIAGEFHLFCENQETHMIKLKAHPAEKWAVAGLYFHNELDTPQYFGIPVRSTDWSDEVNFYVEYVPNQQFYGYAGVAWSTPDGAAKEIFGKEDQLVLELYLSYTFQ
ncbi:MAG: hypothetical protein HY943_17405 [Gammaproteobacteria bacterium]|nr:hypothetical protein [Gammaproteobacteria bacterium]